MSSAMPCPPKKLTFGSNKPLDSAFASRLVVDNLRTCSTLPSSPKTRRLLITWNTLANHRPRGRLAWDILSRTPQTWQIGGGKYAGKRLKKALDPNLHREISVFRTKYLGGFVSMHGMYRDRAKHQPFESIFL